MVIYTTTEIETVCKKFDKSGLKRILNTRLIHSIQNTGKRGFLEA